MRGLLLTLAAAALLALVLVWGFAAGTFWFTYPLVFTGLGAFGLGLQWSVNHAVRQRESRASAVLLEAIVNGAHVVDIGALVRSRGVSADVHREWLLFRESEAARLDNSQRRGECSGR